MFPDDNNSPDGRTDYSCGFCYEDAEEAANVCAAATKKWKRPCREEKGISGM
jgi:hypothetical protein